MHGSTHSLGGEMRVGGKSARKLTPVGLPLPAILLCITLTQERASSPERAGNKGKVTQQFTDFPAWMLLKEVSPLYGQRPSLTLMMSEFDMPLCIQAGHSIPRACCSFSFCLVENQMLG